eukprot:gnl/TRDRNA2_/TRDRNA2_151325_c0_seq1.p1 gnl/TRDRNA2_/TRDRNA2_151325_c0~~gnl/TRDRNA2_/TRDRNA2_151325_c0_seq1.p1  ORF type:complete len:146 (+),score=23.78 gnl/TRDRNA2_/TRDRNA2_151325_c0_seq1:85-522(+)
MVPVCIALLATFLAVAHAWEPHVISGFGPLEVVDGQDGYYDDGTFVPLAPGDVYSHDGDYYDTTGEQVYDEDGDWEYNDGEQVFDDGVWEPDEVLAVRKMVGTSATSIILAAGIGVSAGVIAVATAFRRKLLVRRHSCTDTLLMA